MLEKAVSEAQTSESRVQNFQQWIYRVDDLLNEHLDNDTTMEDLPHDFQVSASFVLNYLNIRQGTRYIACFSYLANSIHRIDTITIDTQK